MRSHFQAHPLTQRSLVLSAAQVNTTATPGTSSEPPPSPDSRSSCDADGWLPSQKDARLLREKNACDSSRRPQTRRSSCAPHAAYQSALLVKLAKMARRRAQQHWCGLCSRAMPSRCVLLPSVTHCVGRLCHARQRRSGSRGPPLAGAVALPACVSARPPGQTVQDGAQARTAAMVRAAPAHCQADACYAW